MNPLEKLRKKLQAIIERMEELNAGVTEANGDVVRPFTEEERASYEAAEQELTATREAIARQEQLESARAEASRLGSPARPSPRVTVGRQENCDDSGEYRGFRSLGEQLIAVMNAATPGGTRDRRLDELRAASGMNESVDSQGGDLIQSDFMSELIRDTYDAGELARRCRRVPISNASNSIEILSLDETARTDGYRGGGVRAYWRAEAAEFTASYPKSKRLKIMLEELTALCYVTDSLLADAPALEGWIRPLFIDEMAFALDTALVLGSGAGQPLGILNAPCRVDVAKKSGQTGDTVVWENVSAMRKTMTKRGRKDGIWLYNNDVLSQLEQMYVPIGSSYGNLVYQPAGMYGNEEDLLYRRPLVEVEACSALGDVGDLIFADMNEYVLIEKGSISADTSIHVRFIYGETTFRFVMRVNGQPLRSAALTPYKGSTTRSPFVAIAVRE